MLGEANTRIKIPTLVSHCSSWPEGEAAVHHGQEFVELVRQERMLDAIAYSRQHLSPWSDLYQADLQRALAALAFRAGALCLVISQPATASGMAAAGDPL